MADPVPAPAPAAAAPAPAPAPAADPAPAPAPAAAGDPAKPAEPAKAPTETERQSLIGEKPAGEKPQAAPEKYEFKYPDGVKVDDAVMGKAQGIFKELGLTNDAAQKIVDVYAEHVVAQAKARDDAWSGTISKWHDEVKGDKEIGSGNDKIMNPEVSARIAKVIDSHLGGDKFRTAMNVTGAGDHPDIIRGLNAISKLLTEGKHIDGKPSTPPKSAAQRMYPNLAKEG